MESITALIMQKIFKIFANKIGISIQNYGWNIALNYFCRIKRVKVEPNNGDMKQQGGKSLNGGQGWWAQ